MPGGRPDLVATSETLDTNSLGGTLRGADAKADATRGVSPTLEAFLDEASARGLRDKVRKVPAFMANFLDALRHLRSSVGGSSHWIVTTGNRTAAGMPVPFDGICRDMVRHLGGRPVMSLTRPVAGKRMPARNGISHLITVETTLVAEFA